MVLGEEVQLGIARAMSHPEIETIPLYQDPVVLVTHPEHPFALRGHATMRELVSEPLILYDKESTYYQLIERACQDAGVAPRIQMLLDSVEATKQMVQRGLGISLLPGTAIRTETAQRVMAQVPLTDGKFAPLEKSDAPRRKLDRRIRDRIGETSPDCRPSTLYRSQLAVERKDL